MSTNESKANPNISVGCPLCGQSLETIFNGGGAILQCSLHGKIYGMYGCNFYQFEGISMGE